MTEDADRPVAEQANPEQMEEATYQPKPPLWQPRPIKRTSPWGIALGIVLVVASIPVIVFISAPGFWAVPTGQVEVTVVRVEAGVPPDEGPGAYRHLVTLPDGSQRRFVSERIYSMGERLLVTEYRGRLTGRRRLGWPYRVLASPAGSNDTTAVRNGGPTRRRAGPPDLTHSRK